MNDCCVCKTDNVNTYSAMLCGGVLGEQRWRGALLRGPIVHRLPARGVNDGVD